LKVTNKRDPIGVYYCNQEKSFNFSQPRTQEERINLVQQFIGEIYSEEVDCLEREKEKLLQSIQSLLPTSVHLETNQAGQQLNSTIRSFQSQESLDSREDNQQDSGLTPREGEQNEKSCSSLLKKYLEIKIKQEEQQASPKVKKRLRWNPRRRRANKRKFEAIVARTKQEPDY
jgi:hypothetical protein